jgi:MFS family permease
MTTSWSRIALLYAIGVLAAGQLGIVPPLVPELQRDLGLSLAGAGTAVSVITLVGAVLGLPAGGWSQRIGHARALAIGLAIMAVAAALCAAANDAATLLAGRTLAGIGYLLVVVAGPSLMAATAEPRHQPMTLSLWGTFVPTGIALAGLAAAGFADRGWRTIFAVDLVLLAAAVIVTVIAVPRDGGVARGEEKPPAGALAASLPLAAAFFCFALLFLAVAGLLPAWLLERRGLAAADAGRIAAIATAFGHPGQPSGRLADARRRVARPARGDRPAGLDGAGRALLHGAAAALGRRGLRPVVRHRRAGAGGDLRVRAAGRRQPARHRTDQRPGGAGRQPGLAGRAAAARRVGRLDRLAVRANAAARDRGAGRGRSTRGQTRFSTTMNHVLPANGTSRPRESTG